MQRGFSLVELSIVLVILGLLTGGILTGQSLIRASELRAVTTEFTRYKTALHSFRDKYFALPGDMSSATKFWGDDNTNCPDALIANGTPGTCNGDGDGVFEAASVNGGTSEEFQFWKQLALAGLLEGGYTGISGVNGMWESVIGTNCPRSKITNGGWTILNLGPTVVSDPTYFDGTYGGSVQVGTQNGTSRTGLPVVKTEEAWNIDTKLDDGKPAYGIVRSDKGGSGNAPNCADSTTASTANYKLTDTSIACRLTFLLGV